LLRSNLKYRSMQGLEKAKEDPDHLEAAVLDPALVA
jgi:hypothetical protein